MAQSWFSSLCKKDICVQSQLLANVFSLLGDRNELDPDTGALAHQKFENPCPVIYGSKRGHKIVLGALNGLGVEPSIFSL